MVFKVHDLLRACMKLYAVNLYLINCPRNQNIAASEAWLPPSLHVVVKLLYFTINRNFVDVNNILKIFCICHYFLSQYQEESDIFWNAQYSLSLVSQKCHTAVQVSELIYYICFIKCMRVLQNGSSAIPV